eukprot:scaffold110436_cov66-Phaeocystis_antarctica.AAC.2
MQFYWNTGAHKGGEEGASAAPGLLVVEHLLEDEARGHDRAAREEGGGELAARHALLGVGRGQQLLDADVAHHAW